MPTSIADEQRTNPVSRFNEQAQTQRADQANKPNEQTQRTDPTNKPSEQTRRVYRNTEMFLPHGVVSIRSVHVACTLKLSACYKLRCSSCLDAGTRMPLSSLARCTGMRRFNFFFNFIMISYLTLKWHGDCCHRASVRVSHQFGSVRQFDFSLVRLPASLTPRQFCCSLVRISRQFG